MKQTNVIKKGYDSINVSSECFKLKTRHCCMFYCLVSQLMNTARLCKLIDYEILLMNYVNVYFMVFILCTAWFSVLLLDLFCSITECCIFNMRFQKLNPLNLCLKLLDTYDFEVHHTKRFYRPNHTHISHFIIITILALPGL